MISIDTARPDSGARSGHIAFNCLNPGFRTWVWSLGVWTFGKGFSSQDGHALPTFALRPEGPWELSPGRRRCALARPGLASGIAESPGRDVGLAFRPLSYAISPDSE